MRLLDSEGRLGYEKSLTFHRLFAWRIAGHPVPHPFANMFTNECTICSKAGVSPSPDGSLSQVLHRDDDGVMLRLFQRYVSERL